MTKIVNFVSGPGAGKSLMSALTFAELKGEHMKCELVQEYAKNLVWQGKLDELNNQYHVTTQQYKMLKSMDGKVDIICTDSPLLLGLYYNKANKFNVSNIEKTEEMILSKMQEFENIYIFLERMDYPYEAFGRLQTESESIEVDRELLKLMDEIGLKYLIVPSSKEKIGEILRYVKSTGCHNRAFA